MKNNKSISILQIYRIITSISIAISGIFLILGALMLYRFGAGSYSREAIGKLFGTFAIPICLAPVLVLVGWIWELFFPVADAKQKASPDHAFLLSRLYRKKDTSDVGDAILAERKNAKRSCLYRASSRAYRSSWF